MKKDKKIVAKGFDRKLNIIFSFSAIVLLVLIFVFVRFTNHQVQLKRINQSLKAAQNIFTDKGLPLILPPFDSAEHQLEIDIPDSHILNVLINFDNQLLVEGVRMEVQDLRQKTKEFILNENESSDRPPTPQDAIISLKTDKGAKYAIYIRVLNELRAAYHELRAEYLNITLEEYLAFDDEIADIQMRINYERAKVLYPMNISEAEPTGIGVK